MSVCFLERPGENNVWLLSKRRKRLVVTLIKNVMNKMHVFVKTGEIQIFKKVKTEIK